MPLTKRWQKTAPSLNKVVEHVGKKDSKIGLLPSSIESVCIDIDEGDPAAFVGEYGEPYHQYPTRRGHHLWYRTFGEEFGNKSLKLPELGIKGDVRSSRGFAVLWGEIEDFVRDYRDGAGYVSAELVQLIRGEAVEMDEISAAAFILAEAPEGQRHNLFRDTIFRLSKEGWDSEELKPILDTAVKAAGNDEQHIRDLKRTFRDACESGSEEQVEKTMDDVLMDMWLSAYPHRIYDGDQGKWFVFTEETGHWREGDDDCIREMNALVRSTLGKVKGKERIAYRTAWKHAAQQRVLNTAANWRMNITSRDGQAFDLHPHLMGVDSGVVDLRTGDIRSAQPTDRILRVAGVEPDMSSAPDLFEKFLLDALIDDYEMIEWIWRYLGYMATGETSDQSFLFVQGVPGTGKSTFVEVLKGVMGGYASTVAGSRWTVARMNDHTQWLAKLNGARSVFSSEIPDKSTWNTERLNEFVGGDSIEANFMRENSISYHPDGKIVIAGNHRPRFPSGDGIVRRMRLVPFDHMIKNPDPHMPAKLKSEWPAVLGKIVRETGKYYEEGLLPVPDAVSAETAIYETESDPIEGFVRECLDISYLAKMPVSEVRAGFARYCSSRQIRQPKLNEVYRLFEKKHGFQRSILLDENGRKCKHWVGFRFKAEYKEEMSTTALEEME